MATLSVMTLMCAIRPSMHLKTLSRSPALPQNLSTDPDTYHGQSATASALQLITVQ